MKNSTRIRIFLMAVFIAVSALCATRTISLCASSSVPCDYVLKASLGTSSLLPHHSDVVPPSGVSLSSPTGPSQGGRRTHSYGRSFSPLCKEGKALCVSRADPLQAVFRPLCGYLSPGRFIHMICLLRR